MAGEESLAVWAKRRLERLAAARKALSDRHAVDPVDRFESSMARIDVARKRERRRISRYVLGEGDPMPEPPAKVRPQGMSNGAWKAERRRLDRAYEDALAAWKADQRKKANLNAPTAEQMDRAVFVEADVTDENRVWVGRAFGRQARFETFDWLTVEQIVALRRYRRAFDASELSPTKCGLDIGSGGGAGGSDAAIARLEVLAFADIAVVRIEAAVPPYLLPSLRAVALHDQDFKALALARYGSASGKRRTRVRQEFALAAKALAAQHQRVEQERAAASAIGLAGAEQTANIDAAFLDDRGIMLELTDIADVIRERFTGQAEQVEQ